VEGKRIIKGKSSKKCRAASLAIWPGRVDQMQRARVMLMRERRGEQEKRRSIVILFSVDESLLSVTAQHGRYYHIIIGYYSDYL
jgi:hypothetical protein